MAQFKKILEEYQKWFNSELKTDLITNFKCKKPVSIYNAVKYALLNGGKRVRPTLLLKTAELFGLKRGDIKQFAFGIEMLHTYSLVHDDLPALDNDDYRRGRLTLHKKYNEATAILAGDALLTMSFECFSKKNSKVTAPAIIKSINLLSEYSGMEGMIGGQVADIESEHKKPDFKKIEFIHVKKTVALLNVAVQIGAVLGNASEKDIKSLQDYAVSFGHAFQISDDILNVTGCSKKMGKNTGTDSQKGKMTYISLFGLEKTKKLCYEHVQQGKKSLKKLKGKDIQFFEEIIEYMLHREK